MDEKRRQYSTDIVVFKLYNDKVKQVIVTTGGHFPQTGPPPFVPIILVKINV
ncbi:hypothetical protein [Lysinibacillus fusiformis]|uniref:hypothetical protein n=1 Tax=Lysinibacillus fusiformis TaxID=28031 RepID=UPI001AD9287D|nr:hypothetical protein [Lysinibacillus fusiformis]